MSRGKKKTADNLELGTAITMGNIEAIRQVAPRSDAEASINNFLTTYCRSAKSETTARTLNAILPGAGYYYVGQQKTAFTSLVMNSLFIGTSYYFFRNGNVPAGILTASFEAGWYLGGINGAGLAAREHNQYIYSCWGKEVMVQNRLFPVLQLDKSF